MPEVDENAVLFSEELALAEGKEQQGADSVIYSGRVGRAGNPVSEGVDAFLVREDLAQGTSSAADLLGRWPMNETSGNTVEDVAGDNDGTTEGSIQMGLEGKEQTAFYFDGNSYVDVAGQSYDITEGFSVTGWGYLDNTNPPHQFVETDESPEPFYLETDDVDGEVGFKFGTDDTSGSNPAHVLFADSTLTDGVWYFFAGVLDVPNSDKRLYIDGNLEGQQDVTWEPATGNPTFLIGVDSNRSSQHWVGRLDDVRIYDQALSSEQVSQIYNTYA